MRREETHTYMNIKYPVNVKDSLKGTRNDALMQVCEDSSDNYRGVIKSD